MGEAVYGRHSALAQPSHSFLSYRYRGERDTGKIALGFSGR